MCVFGNTLVQVGVGNLVQVGVKGVVVPKLTYSEYDIPDKKLDEQGLQDANSISWFVELALSLRKKYIKTFFVWIHS